jgi:hypothetical protein
MSKHVGMNLKGYLGGYTGALDHREWRLDDVQRLLALM